VLCGAAGDPQRESDPPRLFPERSEKKKGWPPSKRGPRKGEKKDPNPCCETQVSFDFPKSGGGKGGDPNGALACPVRGKGEGMAGCSIFGWTGRGGKGEKKKGGTRG